MWVRVTFHNNCVDSIQKKVILHSHLDTFLTHSWVTYFAHHAFKNIFFCEISEIHLGNRQKKLKDFKSQYMKENTNSQGYDTNVSALKTLMSIVF